MTPSVDADLELMGHVPGPLIFMVDRNDLSKGMYSWTAGPRFSNGYGDARHIPTILLEIRREILKRAALGEGHAIFLRVHPEIFRALSSEERHLIEELREHVGMPIHVQVDEHLHHEGYDVVVEA